MPAMFERARPDDTARGGGKSDECGRVSAHFQYMAHLCTVSITLGNRALIELSINPRIKRSAWQWQNSQSARRCVSHGRRGYVIAVKIEAEFLLHFL